MTRLSCSECGCATYVMDHSVAGIDIVCDVCGNFVNYSDIFPHLDEGERVTFDDDGYLCVYTLLESEHDYGYYPEN